MRKRRLNIRISYEVNRLGKGFLLDAYEKLEPIIKRTINPDKPASLSKKEIKLTPFFESKIKCQQ